MCNELYRHTMKRRKQFQQILMKKIEFLKHKITFTSQITFIYKNINKK